MKFAKVIYLERFFSFLVPVSLFFLGNVQAKCIDLTGNYSCSDNNNDNNIEFSISQSVDKQKNYTYFFEVITDPTGLEDVAYSTDPNSDLNPARVTRVTCDEDHLRIYQPTMNTTEKDRFEYRLTGGGLLLEVRVITGLDEEIIAIVHCERTQ